MYVCLPEYVCLCLCEFVCVCVCRYVNMVVLNRFGSAISSRKKNFIFEICVAKKLSPVNSN